jgi:peptidoglycan hydrolase CwlO-like protein
MTYLFKTPLLCFIVILLFGQNVVAQQEIIGSLNGGAISSQFDYLNTVSNNFQEYKVVKKTHLDKIKSNIIDSLDRYKVELAEIQQRIVANNEQMKSFEQKMAQNEAEIKEIQEEMDSFTVMGYNIHKSTYQSVVLGIIGFLTLISLLFIFKYSQSFKVIKMTQKNLNETIEEFEQHRKNTLERERKVKRELIDAMNGRVS